ncbi:hypothetical protein B0T22DRAFT_472840 [Podospora appendiculata]|uniref:Uncharacterized protein n=1 Tax=Podospora appendiculata TaxID=314037 RepID=A0AAE0X049_9PEZI|nr:hypothetical protein B0T22DRAFT_472840 [Podospora appendiculata]
MPKLEELAISIDNPVNGAALEWPADQLPAPSNLQSLDLNFLREEHLAPVLARATQLKTLKWNWWYNPQADSQFVNLTINLDNIATALSHVQGTLTHLVLTASVWPSSICRRPSLRMTGSLAGLATFDSLTTLEIPAPMLFGSLEDPEPADGCQQMQTCLPRNLETLRVMDYLTGTHHLDMWGSRRLGPLIVLWMQDWRASTPRLRRFHLLLGPGGHKQTWPYGVKQNLKLAVEQAGLEFELHHEEHNFAHIGPRKFWATLGRYERYSLTA